MYYIIFTILGIFIGISFKKIKEKIQSIFLYNHLNEYRVKFDAFFLIRGTANGEMNRTISTPEVEILIKDKTSEGINDFIQNLVEDEIKVRIKSIEKIG